MEKQITLGLDIGSNSIGWALVNISSNMEKGDIIGMGTRIIPMSQDILGDFGKGNSISQTAERTGLRMNRRLHERYLLRRERLHRVLYILGFLPDHYASQIDFVKRLGQFILGAEPKLAYKNTTAGNSRKEGYAFIFKESFEEMLADFRQHQPQILIGNGGNTRSIPYDWTIYYLRKKALTKRISKEEIAWILLHFNQKRGYYQARGEEIDEPTDKRIEFYSLKITDVIAEEQQKGNDTWYSLILENGWVYKRSSKTALYDWKNKKRDFIITTELNVDGSVKKDKEGNEKRSFRAPGEDDWTLLKKKTEKQICDSSKTVGEYIYDTLLLKPDQKIRGKLVRTIERKFYKQELESILIKQKEFHPELQDVSLYYTCVRELYKNNEAHQNLLSTRNIIDLFINDILFYQRPLRSQKSSITNCSLEQRKYKDVDGNEQVSNLKAIPKSNPYYQEFRIWQWIHGLSIYKKEDDANVTQDFLPGTEAIEDLFDFLNNRKDIEQPQLIRFLLEKKGLKGKSLTMEIPKYRWNYVEEKTYPCNETKSLLLNRLEKVKDLPDSFLTRQKEQQLWHIAYSVTDKAEYEKALHSFSLKHQFNNDSFIESFKKIAPFKSEYGSFSEKAIKKLLSLMRTGKYWDWDAIDTYTKSRISKLLTGEYDDNIPERVREKSLHLTQESHFQGLPVWLAQYVIYGRHSEGASVEKWNSAEDLEKYLRQFKQHSLRNPIVEQVITETLRTVKDIWTTYGSGQKDYFTEIHIELGREMKNPAEDRKRISENQAENENTNLRIKTLLAEMMNYAEVENVRPYSPMQQEILKIYEEGVLNSAIEISDDILKISKIAQPSSSDLRRYKLWLEQKYKSPYTGNIIPLNKLFTAEYEIEHIIPQSRYFDDSFSNKVICESVVNKLKDNLTGREFIKNHSGTKIELGSGKPAIQIFRLEDYDEFVKQNYAKNRNKRTKLLLDDIPESMIERQLNDTRYISKFISSILSNIVRSENNDDGVNSKNVISCNGMITDRLKQDWGLNDIWNDLILPRFIRLNQLSNSTVFTAWNEQHQKFLPTVPLEHSKGFSKKRIDHRHHAMDALVIACTTRTHVNYMNNEHALRKEKTPGQRLQYRYDLREKLCYKKNTGTSGMNYQWIFKKPWETFTTDGKSRLEQLIISFKQNLRVINKATNRYEKWIEKGGIKKKELVEQAGINWAIRKPMHKDTVSGKVDLKRIKVPKGKILTATRKKIDASFSLKSIESITDTGIQKILSNWLAAKNNDPELAFSAEGLEEMNNNIILYNEGKPHQPIYKARVFEVGSKFSLGESGNKRNKYVEAAKGTNLFFGIYQNQKGKRSFDSIPLNIVIERQKQGLSSVPEENENGEKLLFHLSPNDLVYVPSIDERQDMITINKLTWNKERVGGIYKVVSFSGSQIFFLKQEIATSIVNKAEFSPLNKMERAIDGTMIKETCLRLNIDRLGNIKSI